MYWKAGEINAVWYLFPKVNSADCS